MTDTDKERADYEAWAAGHEMGTMMKLMTWEAWQARAGRETERAEAVTEDEPVQTSEDTEWPARAAVSIQNMVHEWYKGNRVNLTDRPIPADLILRRLERFQPKPEPSPSPAVEPGSALKWAPGEVVDQRNVGPMVWVPLDTWSNDLSVSTFLGRWRDFAFDEVGVGNRIAYCSQDEDGEIHAYGWDEASNPSWKLCEPDEILVRAEIPADADHLHIFYTNHRGESGERRIIPISVRWGSTQWHPETQWLLRAIDVDKGEEREFAMSDIGTRPEPSAEREIFGPHGYLIITPGLNEEHWRLKFSPECDPDEISIALSAEVDPFAVTRAALTKQEGK